MILIIILIIIIYIQVNNIELFKEKFTNNIGYIYNDNNKMKLYYDRNYFLKINNDIKLIDVKKLYNDDIIIYKKNKYKVKLFNHHITSLYGTLIDDINTQPELKYVNRYSYVKDSDKLKYQYKLHNSRGQNNTYYIS